MIEAQSYMCSVGTLGNIEMSECLMFYARRYSYILKVEEIHINKNKLIN